MTKNKRRHTDDLTGEETNEEGSQNNITHTGGINGRPGDSEEEVEGNDFSDTSSSCESDDGQVMLEGGNLLTSDGEVSSEEEVEMKAPSKKRMKLPEASTLSKKQQGSQKQIKEDKSESNSVSVEFTFCDMDEKFFHGIKTLLTSGHPLHSPHSSELSDLMIETVSVGTVVSTQDECVFGFASIININTHISSQCIQTLKKMCLKHCPPGHLKEMESVLSGKTARPAGFFIHARMINLPLEITKVLHQQLILDIDWAVDNAEGGEDERKSLNFGAFVLLAPCVGGGGQGGSSSVIYKYFDDEVFSSNAEFIYSFETPKGFATEDKQLTTVIVLTKKGHRDSMKQLKDMISG